LLAASLPVWLHAGCHVVMPLNTRGPDAEPDISRSNLFVDGGRSEGGTDQAEVDSQAGEDGPAGDGPPCDDIPDYRDPYPDVCKPLLHEETFATDPSGRWTFVNASSWSWSAGKLTQTSTAESTEWAIANITPPLATESYLVEVKVTLGDRNSAAPDWGVGIAGRLTQPAAGTLHYIMVDLWQNPTLAPGAPYNPIYPTMRVLLKNSVTDQDSDPEIKEGGIGGWPYPHRQTPGVDGMKGETYYIQLWHTPDLKSVFPKADNCMNPTPLCPAVLGFLANETQWLIDGWFDQTQQLPVDQYLTTQPGTVGLRTVNRSATFHYIRVYKL